MRRTYKRARDSQPSIQSSSFLSSPLNDVFESPTVELSVARESSTLANWRNTFFSHGPSRRYVSTNLPSTRPSKRGSSLDHVSSSDSPYDVMDGSVNPPSFTSAASPSPSPVSATQKPPRTVQLHLDLGQRSFDQKRCKLCAMVYCPGVASDEALHASQCSRESSGFLTWLAHTRDKVVWGPGEDGIRIVHIQQEPSAQNAAHGSGVSSRVAPVTDLLAAVLGPHSVPSCHRAPRSSSECSHTPPSKPVTLHYFIAIAKTGTVCGALTAHSLAHPVAKLVSLRAPADGEEGSQNSTHQALYFGKEEVKATLGIDQVWVSPMCRRKGVARALLDAARANSVYAHTVPIGEVAFSSPTGDGFSLAAAYRGQGNKVPVFEEPA